MSVRDRALGAWYGQLIGDNLGALVEYRRPEEIAAAYPGGVRDMADGGTHDLAAGQPTDDSEMALALARSLIRRGGYDRADVLASYRRWFDSHPFDVGVTISNALRGRFNEDSQANGALMRISPVAIAYHADPAQAAALARTDAALTHPHSYCLDVNARWVEALARVIHDGTDPLPLLRAHPVLHDDAPGDTCSQQGWVRHAYTLTVDEVARGDSVEEALVRTIGRGGDTDTNAAIVGAFLGGIHGAGAFPRRWRDAVDHCRPRRDRPAEYHPGGAARLVDLLLGIHDGSVAPMLLPEWIAAEIDAGRTALQPLLDAAPFDRAAVRTVAASGDFRIVDGHVRHAATPSPGTWFPQREPTLTASWSLPVVVTAELVAGAAVPVPLAVGTLVEIHRQGHRSLDSRLGPQAVVMDDTEVRLGSIARFLRDLDAAVGDTVHLRFSTTGTFDVSLQP